jgi:type II secretory pathway pseudopilin PulG
VKKGIPYFLQPMRGISFTEVILVLALMSIITVIALPLLPDAMAHSQDHQALVKAEAIQGAQLIYRARVPGADRKWLEAGNDADRYLLLRNAGYLPLSPLTWEAYVPSGYSFALGTGLGDPVSITRPGGGSLNP